MRDGGTRVVVFKSGLAFSKFDGILLGSDHWDKKQYDQDSADRQHDSSAGRLFFRSGVKGPSKEKSCDQSGNEAAEVGHIIDVALKAKEQIQKSKSHNIAQ